ncbi:hypothetical protein F383_17668 [Gossypium arboreum]|uniref:Uncharacterized protein n=1 Tax=Gossypium arboreum TaxID=29729 RepID=A0A0B0NQC4_GOSAR|nr:hypothetical protein F383_17668 [Gossypium arboreum]
MEQNNNVKLLKELQGTN